MANLKGSTGASLGGGIINTRARPPVLEKNQDTCPVCWSGKGFPCQTRSGEDMKLTHRSLRAGKTKPEVSAGGKKRGKKPAARKATPAPAKPAGRRPASQRTAGMTVDQLPGQKSWDSDFPDTWGGSV